MVKSTTKRHSCPKCDRTFGWKCRLTHHLAAKHKINQVWHPCPQPNCSYKSLHKSHLTSHLAAKHKINQVWHPCPQPNCSYKSLQKSHLTSHLAAKHQIGQVWHQCPQPNCSYKTLQKGSIKSHLARTHKINQVFYHCTQPNCSYNTLQKGRLKRHLATKHGINQVWHQCPQSNCSYTALRKDHLNKHIASIHDIGNKHCDICYETCGKVRHIKAVNENVKGADVCRTCCDDYGFRKERIESQYIKGIRKQFDHFMVHDARINGDACLRYRPDAIWLDILCRVHIHFELDEHQHLWKNGSYDCDERRISDIYDEFKDNVPQHYVVVRLNPDGYKGQQTKRSEVFKHRLTHLIEILKRVKVDPPAEKISVIYMYYDRTNHRIAKNLPAYFVDDDTRQY